MRTKFAPTSFSTRSTPSPHIVTTSGSPSSTKDKTKLLLHLHALCWYGLQSLATRAPKSDKSFFTLGTYQTDLCVKQIIEARAGHHYIPVTKIFGEC